MELLYRLKLMRSPDLNENIKGSALMLLAMASFAVGDAIVKLSASSFPLSQILIIRGLFAVIMLAVICALTQQLRSISAIKSKPFILRMTGEVIATFSFFTALFNMPFANASAIMQALPLTVTLGAAFFFGEAIGWRRIIAILVGFAGVLFIIQPGLEGFNSYALYCLVAVFGASIRDLATRKLDADTPSLFVSLVTIIVVMLAAGVLSIWQTWQPVTVTDLLWLAAASLFLMSGFFGITSSMRVGEVAVVTPFRYSVLLFAVVIGFYVFDEIPDALTILGSVIIVLSGIYTIYRESIRRKS